MKRTMYLLWCAFLGVFLAGAAWADVSDTAWKAILHKSVIVEKNDGSSVNGELTAYDADQVVIVNADGTPVVVDRKDVKSVRVQSAAGMQTTTTAQAPAPAQENTSAAQPAAAAPAGPAQAPTTEKKRHVVVNFNPLGNIISSLIIEGVDVTADAQFVLSKFVALGVEPEIALGYYSGFSVWGGALIFPLAAAPEGLFIKAYAGYGSFEGYGTFTIMAACGWQFIWGGFVFSPELGLQYAGTLGFHWRLNIGFAV